MADGIIGSVGVSVVPDSSDFWRRFTDQTRPGAVRAGADLGSDVRRGMQAELDRGVDVRVKADTGTARADIASVGNAADNARGSMFGLLQIGLALSPALIPIGAVAVPAIAALALGLKDAKKQFQELAPEFHQLQAVAGKALAPGVQDLVNTLKQAQPQLRQLIGLFGGAISDEIKKFDDALSNGGLQSFISYAERELPIVEDAFNSILRTVGKLVVTLAPIGNTILVDITRISNLIPQVIDLGKQLDDIYNKIKNIPGVGNSKLDEIARGNLPAALKGISNGVDILSGTLHSFFGGNAEGIISTDGVAAALNLEANAMDNTYKALKKLDAQVATDISNKLAQVQASDAFISAARGVEDSVQQNGKSLDVLTSKGQANRDALVNAAQAALQFYNTQIQAGVGNVRAARTLAGNVKQLELTAIHAGLARGPVIDLLKTMGLVPSQITTKFNVDITQALQAIQSFNNVLSQIPGLGIASIPAAIAAATANAAIGISGQNIKTGRGGVIPGNSTLPGSPGVPTPTPVKLPAASASQPDPQFTKLVQLLQQVRQQRAQEIATIQSAVTGTFDITTAGQNQYGEPVTLFDIQGSLKLALANAKRFETVMRKLARDGLNESLLRQLAEAGPAALPQAQALLSATPRQLAQINREYKQLSSTGQATGKLVGNDLYKAGIQAADGLVRGLRSKKDDLTATMKDLARSMIRELRKELNMHSPSKRLFDEGAMAFEGYRLGIESKAADVAAAAGMIAGKSIPNRAAYKFDGMALRGGSMVAGDFINHQHFDRPVPEPASRSQLAAMRAARNALGAR